MLMMESEAHSTVTFSQLLQLHQLNAANVNENWKVTGKTRYSEGEGMKRWVGVKNWGTVAALIHQDTLQPFNETQQH